MPFIATVLLLTAAIFSCTEAQEAYSKLTESYKKGVDLALQQINNHPNMRHHFLFFKSLQQSNLDASFGVTFHHHNFYLKATRCAKGTANPDPTKCLFRNDRPLIDCVACYNIYNGVVEPKPTPYIHCVHKPSLNADVQRKRRDHCDKMNHLTGGAVLLAQKGL